MIENRCCTTAHYGKWHLGDEIYPQHGFTDWRSIEDMYVDYYSSGRNPADRSTYHQFLIDNELTPEEGDLFSRGETARLPEQYSKPAYLAREASRFIRENQHDPFVLYVNFLEPHMPFFGPRDDQHDPSDVVLPENFTAYPGPKQPSRAGRQRRKTYENGHSGLPLKSEADWRRMIANYWGLCSLVDTYVGQILATLEDCGLDGNTIVVYTSDHGDMMGSHGLIAKCVMFEEAVRVPLLMRLPGQTSCRRVAEPVSQIDLVPTLLDLMGEPVPPGLQGNSLRAVIDGTGGAAETDVFIEWNVREPDPGAADSPENGWESSADSSRSIVTPEGMKFNWSSLGEHELYDLAADPGETTNVVTESEMRPVVLRLLDRVRRWQERTGDDLELPVPVVSP
jgi:arylsulfatase A-like enzyme